MEMEIKSLLQEISQHPDDGSDGEDELADTANVSDSLKIVKKTESERKLKPEQEKIVDEPECLSVQPTPRAQNSSIQVSTEPKKNETDRLSSARLMEPLPAPTTERTCTLSQPAIEFDKEGEQ